MHTRDGTSAEGGGTVVCELHGVARDPQYHRCRLLVQELSALVPSSFLPKCHGAVVEKDYLTTVQARAERLPPAARRRQLARPEPFFLINDHEYLAGEDAFLAFAMDRWRFSRAELLIAGAFGAGAVRNANDDQDDDIHVAPGTTTTTTQPAAVDAEERLQARAEAAAQEAVFRYRQVTGHQYAFLLFAVDGVTLPRVEIELYHRVCPRTCANFVALCEGTAPDVGDEHAVLGYKGNDVHRIVRGGWLQAGDVTSVGARGDGPVRSLYGRHFADESFAIPYDDEGIVAMAPVGGRPHSNGTQFFISLAPLPYLEGKMVAFGRVISGLSTLRTLGALETTTHERPCVPCKIVDAGRIREGPLSDAK